MIVRGIKHDFDLFIKQLSSKYLPMSIAGKKHMVQVAVRPVQFFEVVFPKEHQDLMLNTIFRDNPSKIAKSHSKWIGFIRKIIGIKPVPEWSKENFLPIFRNNLGIIPIGIKDDEIKEDGTTEAL